MNETLTLSPTLALTLALALALTQALTKALAQTLTLISIGACNEGKRIPKQMDYRILYWCILCRIYYFSFVVFCS